MSEPQYALSVALAPGSGLVARRQQWLLFVPEPDDRVKILLDAFIHGALDQTWDRLAEAVIDQDFDVCAFSCVAANTQIEIRVFGEIELKTDLRSVPMLSGAASGTWVEHRVPGHPRSASITTAPDGVDERTTLVDGIVHAGGFTAAIVEQRAHPVETIEVRTPEQAISIPSSTPPLDFGTDPEPDIAEGDSSTLVSYVNDLVNESNDSQDSDDVELGASSDPTPETTLDEVAASRDLPPTAEAGESSDVGENIEAGNSSEAGDGRPMLAARVCKAGHANSPSRAACEVCDVFLPAGPKGVSFEPRPSLGTLVFDDGRRVELQADVMIGRNPSRSGDNWISVVIEGERISRTHLTVRCSDWEVLLDDAGSHNGTVVIPSDGAQPVALVAGTPYLVEPGATAYFGSSSFRIEARTDDSQPALQPDQ